MHITVNWALPECVHSMRFKCRTASKNMTGRISMSCCCCTVLGYENRQEMTCRRCKNLCAKKGGVPDGLSYDTFTCTLLVKPTELTFRVSPDGDSYKLATGTLPDRPGGASGSGACRLGNLDFLQTTINASFYWLLRYDVFGEVVQALQRSLAEVTHTVHVHPLKSNGSLWHRCQFLLGA
jgi:hypothetical protein